MKPSGTSTLLFRVCLRVYPRRFRDQFADSMEETFNERYAERRRRGRAAGFTLMTLGSLIRNGILERFGPTVHPGRNAHITVGMSMMGWVGMILKDVGLGFRALRRRPGFTAVAVSTLALGVGANSAIFSIVNGVLLRPLPYPEPGGLISVRVEGEGRTSSMSYPDIVDIQDEASAIETLIGLNTSTQTLTGLGEPEVLSVARVTAGLLAPFRMSPLLGRDIRSEEFGVDGPAVALISEAFWRQRFGSDPSVLGSTLALNGDSYEVVGVAPSGFTYPGATAIWIPRRMDPEGCGRGCHTMSGVGRIASGSSLELAKTEGERIARRLQEAYPGTNLDKRFRIESLQSLMVGDVRQGLLLMLGAVGLVLLIACANVANLLLVRASARSGEMAVRTALGAGRARLMVQSLTESGILAGVAGVLGLGFALGILEVLPHITGGGIPRLAQVNVDRTVVAFALATLFAVTLLFGLAPALSSARASVRSGLSDVGRGGATPVNQRFRSWLLATEVALCAMLLVGAGLLAKSFQELYRVDVGYDTKDLLRFNINLPDSEYPTLADITPFFRRVEERLGGLPGVESVGSVWGPPLGRGHATGTIYVEGRPEPTPQEELEAAVHSVGPGYLETMGMAIVQGRGLRPSDDVSTDAVALVNERFVREVFPEGDPIGKRVRTGVSLGFESKFHTIVGVIRDMRTVRVTRDPEIEMWMPHGHFGPGAMSITVRMAGGAPSPLPAIRSIVREMNPNLPLYRVETLEQAMSRQVAPNRFYLILAATFALLAALLASVGLYGVAAYATSRRTREIGLRVALGATGEGVMKLIVSDGMRPAMWGLSVGLIGALVGARALGAVLYSVDPQEPMIFVGVALLVVLVTVLATLIPARRATRIDPVEALKAD